MIQRVFVRVVGFSGVERHALNTIFRLSQDKQSPREWSYEPWVEGQSPTAPKLALIDGSSPHASEALQQIEQTGGEGIVWVGSISPAKAWSSFQRPIQWPSVLESMDGYFTPNGELDVDLGGDTWPSVLESTGAHMFGEQANLSALIADPDSRDRMYWLSKLSSHGITQITEVMNVLEARDQLNPAQLKTGGFDLVVIDLDLPGGDPWSVLASANEAKIKLKIVTQNRLSFSHRMSAKVNGAVALGKPIDPMRINTLLADLL